MSRYAIRRAEKSDLPSVLQLLTLESLPTEGVSEHLQEFFVATLSGVVIGAIGLELYGDIALLRSAVVSPSHRTKGVGTLLYDRVVGHAKSSGVRRLVLLTTTAEDYFSRKGFVRIDRRNLRGPVTASPEFTGVCPATAVCMELGLELPHDTGEREAMPATLATASRPRDKS